MVRIDLTVVLVVIIVGFIVTRIIKASRKVTDADMLLQEVKTLRRTVLEIEQLAHNNKDFEPILSDAVLRTISKNKKEIA